jgi:hypothetical protein
MGPPGQGGDRACLAQRGCRTVGGSTLATQIEKYRHSPHGRTDSVGEKLRQMASASLRAYLGGEHTLARRQQILVDYLNTVPLSAQLGFGEVHGLGDGLWAWYGRDFDEVNRLLSTLVSGEVPRAPPAARDARAFREVLLREQALAYKQALSLIVAQRRPSHYLAERAPSLRNLTDSHLRLLTQAGIIPEALRDAALPLPLHLLPQQTVQAEGSFIERKAANAARNRVAALLGVARSYDLERLDLTVDSTLDARAQHQSTEALLALHTPEGARAAGLFGHRLLRERDDPAPLRYSFTLFERGDGVNRLRVQTDNFDQPFDLNEGARLDMGSTAKLRTLVSYLELVARLHARWADLEDDELDALDLGPDDALSRWARDHLRHNEARHLGLMLEAAMDRRYPASPAETFFTGGGVHRFGNFDADDDHRTMSVREAFRRSVNLVFVRLMRDVVQHLVYQQPGFHPSVFDEVASPRRQALLARFADQEGRQFIARFYPTYRDRPAEDAETQLLGGRARRAWPPSWRATAAAPHCLPKPWNGCRRSSALNALRWPTAPTWWACIRWSCGRPPTCVRTPLPTCARCRRPAPRPGRPPTTGSFARATRPRRTSASDRCWSRRPLPSCTRCGAAWAIPSTPSRRPMPVRWVPRATGRLPWPS